MEALLLYLLKANVVLALFVGAYYGLLRRLTFFGLNRAYLLLAVGFAAVYPALPVPALLPAALVPEVVAATKKGTGGGPAIVTTVAAAFDWWQLAGSVYAAGVALLLLRLLAQLLSLAQLHRRARPTQVLGQAVRVVPGTGGPFSFGNSIYLTANTLADIQSLAAALRHEQAHVRQWHTLDVLLLQVAAALAWLNPAVWLLRRVALDNLEYLADQAALHTSGLVRRDYQYLLLRQQVGGVPAPALAFQFSFLTLKNRILMLNQPVSTTRQLGRYLLAAPLVMLLALGYSSVRAQTIAPTPAPELPSTGAAMLANATIYIDGKLTSATDLNRLDMNTVADINVLKGEAEQKSFGTTAGKGTVVVTTKANANSPAVIAFNKRIYKVVPLTPATSDQTAGIAAAKAYVTKNYPTAKLQIVGPAKNQPGRYHAVFVQDGKRLQLFFDGQGSPVQE